MNGRVAEDTFDTHARRLTTIVAADMCGYTALSERDEATAIKLADLFFNVFAKIATENGGRVFNRVADGFLAEFPSAYSGMNCAVEFCKNVQDRHTLSPTSVNAQMRIGVHVGDVVDRDDGNILGHGVNVAVRLQEQAAPGMILISSNLFNLLGRDFKFETKKRSGLTLKNVTGSVTAYEVNPASVPSNGQLGIRAARAIKPMLAAVAVILVIFAAVNVQTTRKMQSVTESIDRIVEKKFSHSNATEQGVSVAYIRTVLDSLHRSEIPSHQASFALLEAGNIEQAVVKLEGSLNEMPFGEELYINTMHQIAALSYYHDSAKAVAYYETLLELDPKDTRAMVALVKGYQVRLEADKAFELYQSIIEKNIGTPYEQIRVQIDMAFSHILQLEFSIALNLLQRIEADVSALGDQRLYIEWQFLSGYGKVRTGDLATGEDMLLATVEQLNEIGADANLPRAYSALGKLYEIKAEAETDVDAATSNLQTALEYYQKQYDAGVLINKMRELPEALYSMGEVYFELEDYDLARQKFLEALRVARSENYITSERRARMGLARLSQKNGDQTEVCRQVEKIKTLYKKSTVKLNEKSLTTLEGLGCGFRRDEI